METPPPMALRRRNSIDASAIPTKLLLPSNTKSSSFPPSGGGAASVDFELLSFKSSESYTSLKDLLPPTSSAVNSPTGATAASSSAISIRNRLVKQAAWAYLQPMSTSPDSSGRHFFRRMWTRFSGDTFRNPVSACLEFINRHVIPTITRAFDRLLQAIRVRTHR